MHSNKKIIKEKKLIKQYTPDEITSKFNIKIVDIWDFKLPKDFKFEDLKVYYPTKLLQHFGQRRNIENLDRPLYSKNAKLSALEFDAFMYSFLKYMQDRFLLIQNKNKTMLKLPAKFEELKRNGYTNLMMYTSKDSNKLTRVMIETFYNNFVKPYKGRLTRFQTFETEYNRKVEFPTKFETVLTAFNRRFNNSPFGNKINRQNKYNIDGTKSGKRTNNVYSFKPMSLFFFPDDYLKESGQPVGVITKRSMIARILIEPTHEIPVKTFFGRPVYQGMQHNPFEAKTTPAMGYIQDLVAKDDAGVAKSMTKLYKFIRVPAQVAYAYRQSMRNLIENGQPVDDIRIAVYFNALNYEGLKEGIDKLLDGKPIDSQNPLKSSFKDDMFRSQGYLYEGYRYLADPNIEYITMFQSLINRDRVNNNPRHKLKPSDFKLVFKDHLNTKISDTVRVQHIVENTTDIKTHLKVTDTYEYRTTGELKEYSGLQITGKSLFIDVIPRLIAYMRFSSAKPLVSLLYKLHMNQSSEFTGIQLVQNLKKNLRGKLVDHNVRLSSGIFKKDAAMGTLTKMSNMLALANPAPLLNISEQYQLPGLKAMYYFTMFTLKSYGHAIDFNKPLFDVMYSHYVPSDYVHDDSFYIMTALKDETKNVSPLNQNYIKKHAEFLERYYLTNGLLEKVLGSAHNNNELQNLQDLTFLVDLVAHHMSNAVSDKTIKSLKPEEANGILRYHPLFSAMYRLTKGTYSELFYEDNLTIELRLTSLRHQYVEVGNRILSEHSISIPHKLLQNLELYIYGKFEYPEVEEWVLFNHSRMTEYLRYKQLSKQEAGEPEVNMSLVEALLGC